MIYTGYFGKLRQYIKYGKVTPIAICLRPPTWYEGSVMSCLMPEPEDLREYHNTQDWETYCNNYRNHTLGRLSVDGVIKDISSFIPADYRDDFVLYSTYDVVLLCFERVGENCHRNLVSEWFREAGIPCKEWV